MARIEKTVFISYRHTNAFLARAIFQSLTHSGFDVFLDYQGIASGDFERVILKNIRARAHFLVLLTPSALERCDTPGDWLRREIEEALETRRNIVPLMLEGFDFGAPAIATKLTGKLAVLKHYNGMTVPAEYFDAAMTKLRDKFLNVPLDAVLHPASKSAKQAAKTQQDSAAAAPPVQPQELTAQEWFERGTARYWKRDYDGAINDTTEAIRLQPANADAYIGRGRTRDSKGDDDGAINDYTEGLRLQPDNMVAYCIRGAARNSKGDYDGAINDYTEAIRLQPDSAEAYTFRGFVFQAKGNMEAAQRDLAEAARLDDEWLDSDQHQ
jgi:tetratricopeptide (TPR) repeat protein